MYTTTSMKIGNETDSKSERLVRAIQKLSMTTTVEEIIDIVAREARILTGADGATLVLREEDKCYYVNEDAIGPLWKGKKFPLTACISGWSMLHRENVAIEDVFKDPRIPIEAYKPTFVKSLVMLPIRMESPIGAIGNYWASPHKFNRQMENSRNPSSSAFSTHADC